MIPRAQIYCIFGGTGFVGSHLVDAIIKRGDADVRVLSRLALPNSPRVSYFRGDLSKSGSWPDFLVAGATVINLAPLSLESANELARRCVSAGVRRLIHVSTATVVGATTLAVVDEDTPCRPQTEYELVKLGAEQAIASGIDGKVDFAILRPSAIFGKGGRNLVKTLEEVRSQPVLLRAIKAMVLADRQMNLVPVESVIQAILFLCDREAPLSGERFIVSCDNSAENSYASISQILSQVAGVSRPRVPKIVSNRVVGVLLRALGKSQSNPSLVYSSEKLRRLGFRDKVNFRESLIRFASEFLTDCNRGKKSA